MSTVTTSPLHEANSTITYSKDFDIHRSDHNSLYRHVTFADNQNEVNVNTIVMENKSFVITLHSVSTFTEGERKEETWIQAYLKIAGATTSMLPRLVPVGCGAKRLKLLRGNTLVHSCACAGTGQVSSFLSPPVTVDKVHNLIFKAYSTVGGNFSVRYCCR
ncbi:hypothetical protein J6590_096761 [Homalodisca vitripennis]|nr:hypothetical protein J6590_096761 [Homalodisca vitripennis]